MLVHDNRKRVVGLILIHETIRVVGLLQYVCSMRQSCTVHILFYIHHVLDLIELAVRKRLLNKYN